MSELPTSPTAEVTVKLKHRDWEVEVTCTETRIRGVIEDILSSIDNVSHDEDPTLAFQINEIKKEIESLKTTMNNLSNSKNGLMYVHRKTAQKGGATCRSLLEKFLFEGYFETEKLLGSVHEELSRRGYSYDRTAVSHSLTDMVRESILTRVGSLRNYRYLRNKPLSGTGTPR